MFSFEISPDGGAGYTLVATTRDIARWEKLNKGAGLRHLQAEMRATDLYAVAYYAAVRQGYFHGTLAEFQDSCDIDMADEDGTEPDPTQPAA